MPGEGSGRAVGRGSADGLRRRVAELVVATCDGGLGVEEAEAAPSLAVAGLGSLDSVRLIDAVEREFGVTLADDPAGLDSVAALAEQVRALGAAPAGGDR